MLIGLFVRFQMTENKNSYRLMVVEDDEGVLPSIVGIGDVRAPIHTIEIDKGLSTEGIRATRVDAC